jgi:hypothetical protein
MLSLIFVLGAIGIMIVAAIHRRGTNSWDATRGTGSGDGGSGWMPFMSGESGGADCGASDGGGCDGGGGGE